MRAEQIDTSGFVTWVYSSATRQSSDDERWCEGGGVLAVSQSPGRARHFRPYPSSRRYRRR